MRKRNNELNQKINQSNRISFICITFAIILAIIFISLKFNDLIEAKNQRSKDWYSNTWQELVDNDYETFYKDNGKIKVEYLSDIDDMRVTSYY